MTGVCKDRDRKTAEGRQEASPTNDADRTSVLGDVALDEMRHHENDQVADRDQGDDARVLERIETP